MPDFIAGVVTFGYLVVAAFFLKFWRRTSDTLFAIFALAFVLLAANSAMVALAEIARESVSWVYLLRAAAFSLIIAAIVRKNLPARP